MALTQDELLAAVNAVPGLTAEGVTKTLMVGGLTTAIAQVEDSIIKEREAFATATQQSQARVAALEAQKVALLDQRKSLLG